MTRISIYLALVTGVVFLWARPLGSAQMSPSQIVERFCEMDAQGMRLTPEGLREMATSFPGSAGTVPSTKTIVVRDFVVSRPEINGNRGELYVEYVYLGSIDVKLGRFSRLPYLKVRSGFDVVRTDGFSDWKISVAPPESHITVSTAVNYVKRIHDAATDLSTRKNAARAIANLSRLTR